jgi:CheY-like chemotaxis protein
VPFTESKHQLASDPQTPGNAVVERPSFDTWEDLHRFTSETLGDPASPIGAEEGDWAPVQLPLVLLAHSDEVRRGGLAWELGAQGCSVVEVEDGSELLDYLDDQGPWLPLPHPDVIVADLSMEGIDGLEAARRLRRAGDQTPIVFINVHRSPSAAAAAARLPHCRLLHGEVEGGVLRAAVEEALHGKS